MSVQGELVFSLQRGEAGLRCDLRSTRPVGAVRWFEGKSMDFALMSVPMLFNVCGKAQAVTLVRAIESARGMKPPYEVKQCREALVKLETLREQVFRVLVDWPSMIGETTDSKLLGDTAQAVAQLSEALGAKEILGVEGAGFSSLARQRFSASWSELATALSNGLWGMPAEAWLQEMDAIEPLERWLGQAQNSTSRFLIWLDAQPWSAAGSSMGCPEVERDDEVLQRRMEEEGEAFAAEPDFDGVSPEQSWFTAMEPTPLIEALEAARGNGIYTRCIARLVFIAQLLRDLQKFSVEGVLDVPDDSPVPGMAHTEAARGRLTHWLRLRGDTLERFCILAPTEWNFHPQGVARRSLESLWSEDPSTLERQARLLIQAIDPCVGYQLEIQDVDTGAELLMAQSEG